jgi:hypothetical protein
MTGPMAGLSLDDDFDVTVIVRARHEGGQFISAYSTTGDCALILDALAATDEVL